MTDKRTDSAATRELLADIVREMLVLFPIDVAEAQGRVARFWTGWRERIADGGSPDDLLGHEDSEYWAKSIYYGTGVHWWRGEDGLPPVLYP